MVTAPPFFSIVTVNWNGQRFLDDCFASLQAQSFKDFEFIMVDNGSTDDSIPFTKKKYPWVKIIELGANTGFAHASNVGIQAGTSPYVILLNNDTEVDPTWLKELHRAITRYPEIGFFACKMLDFADRSIIDRVGDAMTWSGRSYQVGENQKDDGQFDEERMVFGACAGAACYKRELFEKVGYLDTDFFMYMEDVDLDFRAQLAGFTCRYLPQARVYHIGSASTSKQSAFSFKHMVRNHLWMIYKNFPSIKIWTNLHKIIYSELRLLGAARKHKFWKEYVWAIRSAVHGIPAMRKKRKQIQRLRTVSLAYLDTIIEADFTYKPLLQALKK